MLIDGIGLIGSAVIGHLVEYSDFRAINFDKLTYAGNLESFKRVANHPRYHFEIDDICNTRLVTNAFNEFQPRSNRLCEGSHKGEHLGLAVGE